MYVAFHDAVESDIGTDKELAPIRSLANKLPEHAARLAGVLALIQNMNAAEISDTDMANAFELAKHYAAESLRLFAVGSVDPQLRLAGETLDWLQSGWRENMISLPDVYQCGPSRIRDGATARRIMDILEDHGWVHCVEGGATVNGKRRSKVWRIVRRDQS